MNLAILLSQRVTLVRGREVASHITGMVKQGRGVKKVRKHRHVNEP